MSKKLVLVLSLAMAVLPGAAYALGLGEIKLNSALNDKFSADIQVVGATSDELDSLDVKLASLAQFSQAGLDHPEVLGQLQFVVVRNADGTAYVHITSSQAVREPFLDFLIDANWNNGELIREYTVLLNPQSFQTATAPKPEAATAPAPVAAVAPAPVVTAPAQVSAPAPAPAEAPAPAPAQPEATVAATEQPAAPAPQPAASPPPAPTPAVETAPAQRALGANYGPIHRGETLSSIAKQVRPDGVTLNQMMIAIYQANSEVFMHNINRMKAGYILRMPTASDAQAVSVVDANAEVRAQMEAWRNNRGAAPAATTTASAQPALQLVAPSSAAESSAPVPGAEKQGSGETTAKEEKPAEPVASTEEPVSPAPAPTPAAPPANQAPLAVKNNGLAAVQQQAAQQAAQPAPSVLPAPEPAKNTPLTTTPAAKPAAAAQESGGGFLDAILNIYVLGAIIVVAIVVLLGVMIKKRKKGPSAFNPGGTARIKGADWLKQEQVGGTDDATEAASSTTRTRSKMKKAEKAAPEPERSEDKTVLVARPNESAADDSDKTMLMSAPPQMMQDTMVGSGTGGSGQLDMSEPMAEADFHMAYGLYDQAADVLRKALRQSPDRQDIQVKLLEVFFTAGDRDNFVSEAKKLRQSMGAAPSKDWDSVAIMGRQVAPNEPLFTSSGAPSGAAVDIALGAGGTDTVVSDLGDAFTASHEPPSAPEPAPAAAAPAADNLMEFSLPDIEPAPSAPAAAEAPKAGGMEFDLGDLNFEPTPAKPGKEEKAAPTLSADEPTVATDFGTDSQVEFDKALNDLAAFVNTNVPAQPEAGSEPAMGNLSMDDAPAPALASGGDEPAASSISEIGTKLDLARAYIDMGDPDGAKSILAEVTSEGNAQQKQEAQELLKHLG